MYVMMTFSMGINTYHLLVWKAGEGLSYQVQPVPGSLHAKRCLFPGSFKKEQTMRQSIGTHWNTWLLVKLSLCDEYCENY